MHDHALSQASSSQAEQLFRSVPPVQFAAIELLPPESQPAAVHRLDHDVLLRRLGSLAARDRVNEAELLVHIAEVDACRLFGATCSSMYKYCLRVLHMSEGTAYKRISAARVGRRYPVVLAAIADGRLHLSAVVLLRPHLTPGTVDELVRAATHLTQKQTELMLAQRFPKPDVPTVMKALVHAIAVTAPQAQPEAGAGAELSTWTVAGITRQAPPAAASGSELSTWTVVPPSSPDSAAGMGPLSAQLAAGPASQPSPDVVSAATAQLASSIAAQLGAGEATSVAPQAIVQAVSQALAQAVATVDVRREEDPALRSKITPLSPGRFCWQFTMPQRAQDLMDEARDLAGGDPRANDPVEILIEALAIWVEKRRKEKFAEVAHPRAQCGEAKGRHIPAAIRRIVAARDGRQCTFVSADGTRCDERRDLQFDHIPPLACGGETSAGNLRLLCRAHNQHVARLAFGAAHMKERTAARRRAALQRKARARGAVPGADTPGTAQAAPVDRGRREGGVSMTRGDDRDG